MDRRKEHVHVTNATRWNSTLRSIESYLDLAPATLDELREAVPTMAPKIVDEAGSRALQELVEVSREYLCMYSS